MSNKLYTTIPAPRVPRNMFDRSAPCSLTMPFQRVCPTLAEEILPGDLYRVGTETFARLQPLIAPVMNNMKISQHFFYVPLRTINENFAKFMFNDKTGNYTNVLPYADTGILYGIINALDGDGEVKLAAEVIRLYDFIGLPFRYSSNVSAGAFVSAWLSDAHNVGVSGAQLRINLCPFFAYTKVWSEYFRDENVMDDPFEWFESQTSEDVFTWYGDCGSIVNSHYAEFATAFLQLRRRAWQHDRFTSALPFAQRGPDVLLPVSGTAPVVYEEGWVAKQGQSQYGKIHLAIPDQSGVVDTPFQFAKNSSSTVLIAPSSPTTINPAAAAYDPNGSLYADFDQATLTTTINEFRRAERLERWYENSARGGIRPNEATLAHFGVVTPDATLQRAQFLGGSMQPLVISEVAQTSQTTTGAGGSPQGTLAGKGTSYKGNRAFRAYFTEHGYVFCLTSALVRANYWQGIPKIFSRMTRDEYYWPEFANLGEEPVYVKEIYAQTGVSEDEVFGYVPRYSDYKSAVGTVHGDMRSSLSFWTQTREFANKPQLNEEFLFGDPSLSPFAVQSLYSDPIICTIQFTIKASRLMPFYGVPTI